MKNIKLSPFAVRMLLGTFFIIVLGLFADAISHQSDLLAQDKQCKAVADAKKPANPAKFPSYQPLDISCFY